MPFILYKIENKVNGKLYIGQTTRSLSHRWSGHISKSKNIYKTEALYRAIRKYGKDSFNISELCRVNNLEELNELESFIIKEMDTLSPRGYNLRSGGDNSLHSAESIKNMSISQSALSDIKREKMKEVWKTRDKATLQPMIAYNKGRIVSEATRKKLSLANLGKKHSEETRAKMSERAQNMTEETKKKISEKLKGIKRSPETRAKMSIARLKNAKKSK